MGAVSALASRLIQAAKVAVLIGTATFAMMRNLQGDAAWRIAAGRYGCDRVDAAAAETVRAELSLGGPALPALLHRLGVLMRLDSGVSLVSGQPVMAEIGHHLGAPLSLALVAVLVSLLIGPPPGILAGLRPAGAFDHALLVVSTGLTAVPQFLMALVLIVLLAVSLRLLPAAGHGEARHFVLPALTLALGLAAMNARIARGAMARIADVQLYRFAWWKGLSPRQTLIRHGLRNVSVPLVTHLGLQFVTPVEGVIVVEANFGWPGIGHALVHAIFSRNVPTVAVPVRWQRARLAGGVLIALVAALALLGPVAVPGDPVVHTPLKALSGPDPARRWATTISAGRCCTGSSMRCACRRPSRSPRSRRPARRG